MRTVPTTFGRSSHTFPAVPSFAARRIGERLFMAGSLVFGAAVLLLFPLVHAVIVAVNFVVHAVVMLLQLVAARLPRPGRPAGRRPPNEPFVSIHVPAHNEPPALLRQTLRSLSRLQWQNFEVLVIDNNTTDESLWRPIEEYCRELGPRFRFFHVENLSGFKAGAMNHVRQFMDPRAEFIFVVDADYVVEPDALQIALSHVEDPQTGLVQFPQDYRNIGPGNRGMALDFKHFFAGYMTMANALQCVPSTGTLSLIRVSALRSLGGFNTQVVTEDAELGLRLGLQGFRSVYVNETIGRGVMPHDLEALKKQRWRWAFGNAQILKLNWRRIFFAAELNWRQKLGYLTHLTAWFNFNLVPGVSLILLAPLALLGMLSSEQEGIIAISGLTVTTYLVMRFGTLFYSLRREGHTLGEIWLAYLTHIGLGWVFSTSWLKCLWDHRSPFVRTNKFVGKLVPGPLRVTLAEVGQGVCLVAACLVLAATGFVLGPLAALLLATARFLVFWVWRQTQHTWELSRAIDDSFSRGVGRPRVDDVSVAEKDWMEPELTRTEVAI